MCEPDTSDEELRCVVEAVMGNELSGQGKHVAIFEDMFAEFTDCEYATLVPNGTIAINLALATLGVGRGDEVIIPSQTICCVGSAIAQLGATSVVVDVRKDTWAMDVDAVKLAITPNTKVIMPTPIFVGMPPDMDAMMELTERTGIFMVEDFAEAIGVIYESRTLDEYKKLGSMGDLGCCSFFANKTISLGEGGIITTNSIQLDKRLKYLRNNAYSGDHPADRFTVSELGYNYRPHNLAAALGIGQMRRRDHLVERRREINRWYHQYLDERFTWQIWPFENELRQVPWMNAIYVGGGRGREFMTHMLDKGIETRPTFFPMGRQPFLQKLGLVRSVGEPVSEDIWLNGVLLPSGGPSLTATVVKYVCDVANEFPK